MKIAWRNPKGKPPKRIAIVNTRRVEAEDLVHVFYHSSSGPGILGTHFELRANRTRAQYAA